MKFLEVILGIGVGLLTLPLCLIGALVGLRGVGRYLKIKSM
jgi:hypothetical protein